MNAPRGLPAILVALVPVLLAVAAFWFAARTRSFALRLVALAFGVLVAAILIWDIVFAIRY